MLIREYVLYNNVVYIFKEYGQMLNYIWVFFILTAIILGIINGRIKEVTDAALDSATSAVTISIGLIGLMAFWLGMMKIAEDSKLINLVSKAVKPLALWLFPEVPSDHPAIGAMVMNITANMLGLGNAATPLGIKAMEELEKLNQHKGVATNAMCTFLGINTAGIQLIPIMVIAVLSEKGYTDPTQIISSTIIVSTTATIMAIISAKLLERVPAFSVQKAIGDNKLND